MASNSCLSLCSALYRAWTNWELNEGCSIIFCCEYNEDCHPLAPEIWFSEYIHTLPIITVKSEPQDSHLQMKEHKLKEINYFLCIFMTNKWHSETSSILSNFQFSVHSVTPYIALQHLGIYRGEKQPENLF